MDKIVTRAIQKVAEEADSSVTMAALLGAGLDSAAFAAAGAPPGVATAAGAAMGAAPKIYEKIRRGGEK